MKIKTLKNKSYVCGNTARFSFTTAHEGIVTHYDTNHYGFGLWKDGQQILGTSQFELNSVKHPREKLRRFLTRD